MLLRHVQKSKIGLFKHFQISLQKSFATIEYSRLKPKAVDRIYALKKFIGPTLAIIGRPNVGKSSLFNRLAGKEVAIVHRTAGITRDRKVGQGRLSDLHFVMIDTPGYEELTNKEKRSLKNVSNSMVRQSELALKDSDGALFVVDARDGITSNDYAFADWLKNRKKALGENLRLPIILVANKAESKDKSSFIHDVYQLDMGEPVYISAKHNEGMSDLYTAIRKCINKIAKNKTDITQKRIEPTIFDPDYFSTAVKEKDPLQQSDKKSILQLAIVGRPNVGKSTLVNAVIRLSSDIKNGFESKKEKTDKMKKDMINRNTLHCEEKLNEKSSQKDRKIIEKKQNDKNLEESTERVITSSVPGTTRDSISINLNYFGRLVKLIDTAGICGANRMAWRLLEKEMSLAMDDTMRSLNFSNVACLLLEIPENAFWKEKMSDLEKKKFTEKIFQKKDRNIAKMILREGRALVIALNKCDRIHFNKEKKQGKKMKEKIETKRNKIKQTKKDNEYLELSEPSEFTEEKDENTREIKNKNGENGSNGKGKDIRKEEMVEKTTKIMSEYISGLIKTEGGTFKVVNISALRSENIKPLMDAVIETYDNWRKRISTAKINKWLIQIFRFQPPPSRNRKPTKIRFITQVKTRPPTFALFTSQEVPTSYRNFLSSKLHQEFGFDGVPVRLLFKRKENPFASRKPSSKRPVLKEAGKSSVLKTPLKRKT